jgi:hypothetical protein
MRCGALSPTFDGRKRERRSQMPRYVVERTFTNGIPFAAGVEGEEPFRTVERNSDECVTWLHSYVSEDRRMTFCVYEAPNPEAIRRSAQLNALPVDRITRVDVLDPYSYR